MQQYNQYFEDRVVKDLFLKIAKAKKLIQTYDISERYEEKEK